MDSSTSPRRRSQLLSTLVVVAIVVIGLIWLNHAEQNRPPNTQDPVSASTDSSATDPVSGLPYIDPPDLPEQARETIATIRNGGPYSFPSNDNQTYFNNNGILPSKSEQYYREYTVSTPGVSTRGARRIISGSAGELYYTDDHYSSFSRIRENL